MSVQINSKAGRLAEAAAAHAAGDLARAERLWALAALDDPADPAPHHNLAGLYAGPEPDRAEACYRRALALQPEAAATRRALGVLLLSLGRYPEGFALFEARHALPQYGKPDLPFPEWREGPSPERLLIWPEQGFGDQIQFARFAPVLQARGVAVTLVCWPPLARLFAQSFDLPVIAAAGVVDFPDPDAWVMAMSLAARLGVTPDTIPDAPYLRAAAAPSPRLRGLPSGFRVGLMTRGNPAYAADQTRSLTPAAEAALHALPATVVGLAPEQTGAADFADTAALIAGLDLVISVDTAVAHLAGAMGKPCWILLPAKTVDWRWLRGRSDSPWYPSARLYRQTAPGDWDGVVATVAADLAKLTAPP
jgi:tetratricopeptide (TPR) repeat protein